MSRSIHYCDCGEEIFDTMEKCNKCEGGRSIELRPHEIELLRLERDIAEMIEKDRRAYAHRKWLLEPSRKEPEPKRERDPRGAKKGVKRGPYKKRVL